MNTVRICYLAREYERGIREASKLLELEADYSGAYYFLGLIYDQTAEFEKAEWAYQQYNRLQQDNTEILANRCRSYALSGRIAESRELLVTLSALALKQQVPPCYVASAHLALGDIEECYAWLEKAYEARDTNLISIKVDPRLDGLRNQSKFSRIVARVFNGSEQSARAKEAAVD